MTGSYCYPEGWLNQLNTVICVTQLTPNKCLIHTFKINFILFLSYFSNVLAVSLIYSHNTSNWAPNCSQYKVQLPPDTLSSLWFCLYVLRLISCHLFSSDHFRNVILSHKSLLLQCESFNLQYLSPPSPFKFHLYLKPFRESLQCLGLGVFPFCNPGPPFWFKNNFCVPTHSFVSYNNSSH